MLIILKLQNYKVFIAFPRCTLMAEFEMNVESLNVREEPGTNFGVLDVPVQGD